MHLLALQKSYTEGVGAGFPCRIEPPPYSQNVRYQLAKSKVDDLFVKWLSIPATQKLISSLVNDLKQGKTDFHITQPNPHFQNKMTMSGMQQIGIHSPSNKIRQSPSTPPRSDFDIKPRVIYDDYNESMAKSVIVTSQPIQEEPPKIKPNINYDEIPKFYQPDQPLDPAIEAKQKKIINDVFGTKDALDSAQFELITTTLCGLCVYLNDILFQAIEPNGRKLTKAAFLRYWNAHLANKEPKQRCFHILKSPGEDFIAFNNFRPFMLQLLEKHPGLEFLKATPDFQERYADTVIHRIFYAVCLKDNGKIYWRDFKRSNLFDVIEQLGREDDINKIRQYFSYEHFYVIYCKFWELDGDHDFHITKEDFSRYSSHCLSRKAVDRIFDQVPRKFRSAQPGKMSYEDFIYFIISEEDKTTVQSVEYWFKVIDLDSNGIIAGREMQDFYDEQKQRMEYLNQEPILFEDFVCQMVDLLRPENDIHFTLKHFKSQLSSCGVFFNYLTNLNKLVAYENRDPFAVKQEITDHPEFSDWDRFAYQEYVRLAMEEENQEQGEVFEGDNLWDNDSTQCTQ